jgi:hypothetical protein
MVPVADGIPVELTAKEFKMLGLKGVVIVVIVTTGWLMLALDEVAALDCVDDEAAAGVFDVVLARLNTTAEPVEVAALVRADEEAALAWLDEVEEVA